MKVKLEALTRVEGEGALEVYLEGGKPTWMRLSVYEPPRFIEGILRGKPYHVIPDITARICGICPVAYQISGVQAVEDAFGVEVPEELQKLRRLMYYGEWIQSHALHVFLLHLPDFFGVPSFLELAKIDRELALAGLEVKRCGGLILQTLGGRTSHPVSLTVGGFSFLPESLSELLPSIELALEKSFWSLEKLKALNFPNFELRDLVFVSLWEEEYPILKGDIYFEGQRVKPSEFKEVFEEFEVPYSTAKHARLKEGRVYLVGPLARFNNAFEMLSHTAKEVAFLLGLEPPVKNPYRSLLVRMVEIIHALEKAKEVIKNYKKLQRSKVEVKTRASEGFGVSEAPRGILWHHYAFDQEGRILSADIVPPTSQNQPAIELSLWEFIKGFENPTEETLKEFAEPMIRNFDPCISCATHFLRVEVKKRA
ncbi:MAG: Ni/Fe hydrogenase subunit alpha [Aquificaceae bacterium]|nr:Ni/Fe hydrogenase subunit alpha [Aquificaceae bacterium]MCX7990315.1 Ni/Fe hydrogenase subunit alpha [Aquificaceae bacterium]